ncbi:unnamed protein product [Lampetra planeri]
MSKSGARRKTAPGIQTNEEDDAAACLSEIPEIGAPETCPLEVARLEPEEAAAGRAAAPPSDMWRDVAAQLELLQRSVTQLAVALSEVGVRTHAAGDGVRDRRDLSWRRPCAAAPHRRSAHRH